MVFAWLSSKYDAWLLWLLRTPALAFGAGDLTQLVQNLVSFCFVSTYPAAEPNRTEPIRTKPNRVIRPFLLLP